MTLRTLESVPLNTTDIAQAHLNIVEKDRSNLFPWNGQFSPQLVEALLDRYSKSGDTLMDPFAGSGTVLSEAGRKGLSASATEINPAAFCMARTYHFINASKQERQRCVKHIDEVVKQGLSAPAGPLFSTGAEGRIEKEGSPVDLDRIQAAAAKMDEAARILYDALIIRLDLVLGVPSEQRLLDVWGALKALVLALPFSTAKIEVHNRDARAVPLPKESIDLVVTSPPYMNVFNYHQHYRRSAEALGWDLLHVARSEIGSNRKHRQNRFLTVTQYCLDIAQVFQELARACRPSARVIFVVGRESNVRKTSFYNASVVTGLATGSCGFKLLMRQERVFKNRFGQAIFEDILHFEPPTAPRAADLKVVRTFAREVLNESLERAPVESHEDLRAALEQIEDVMPSPIYEPSAST